MDFTEAALTVLMRERHREAEAQAERTRLLRSAYPRVSTRIRLGRWLMRLGARLASHDAIPVYEPGAGRWGGSAHG
jgi:hypothetical protein